MAFNINEIRANLQFDGARPSLFEIIVRNPATNVGDSKLQFMAKASSIPESIMGVIEVPYFGRKIKVAGVRQYADWSIQVINDEDFAVRRAMEAWHSRINSSETNLRTIGNAYRSTAFVNQYSKEGEIIRTYTMENCWPINIGAIDLSWDNGDAIEEFPVTFAFDYWNVAGDGELTI
jgi:hypothetical protein